MLYNDFIAHLARKGVLRDAQMANGGLQARQGDGLGNLDWVGLTKLTPSALPDRLAAFLGWGRLRPRAAPGSGGQPVRWSAALGAVSAGRTSLSLPGFVRKSDACDCTPDRWRNGQGGRDRAASAGDNHYRYGRGY